ncbi:hypothetical protein AB0368_30750 [Actinoplanes sp. NPDC051475]|uniref:hypothetical protein n=1 Tax=Actinoplanes sp. NPDC051475 TaxID=3157225 RepID=UPI00344C45F1
MIASCDDSTIAAEALLLGQRGGPLRQDGSSLRYWAISPKSGMVRLPVEALLAAAGQRCRAPHAENLCSPSRVTALVVLPSMS